MDSVSPHLNQKTAMPPRKKQQTLVSYSIVDPQNYMNKTVCVPGVIFGDFADTEEKKRKLYPMLVVGWDKDARCPDHRSGDLTGVVTVAQSSCTNCV